jgi:hypothetical protein
MVQPRSRLEHPDMPRRVRPVEGWAGEPASRRRGLALVVLKLVSTLAAHAFEVIPSAGMLTPRMTTLWTVAQLPEPAGLLPTLPMPCQEAAHGVQDASVPSVAANGALIADVRAVHLYAAYRERHRIRRPAGAAHREPG